jgi:hypothetical protein
MIRPVDEERPTGTSVARHISKGLRIGAAPRCGWEQTESHESPWQAEPDNNHPAVRSAPFFPSPIATQVLCILVLRTPQQWLQPFSLSDTASVPFISSRTFRVVE